MAGLADHRGALEHPKAPRPLRESDIDFGHLISFVDVVYGAVLGYILLRISEHSRSVFAHTQGEGVSWTVIVLELFVLNFMVGDFVEARLFNGAFPYTRHTRFVLDLTVAFCFLLTFLGAEAASVWMLVPLSLVFFGGAAWAYYLKAETKNRISWSYPWLTVGFHIGAGCLCLAFLLFRTWVHQYELHGWGVGFLWICYVLWTCVVTGVKEFWKVPHCEAQMFPVGLSDVLVRNLIRGLREDSGTNSDH